MDEGIELWNHFVENGDDCGTNALRILDPDRVRYFILHPTFITVTGKYLPVSKIRVEYADILFATVNGEKFNTVYSTKLSSWQRRVAKLIDVRPDKSIVSYFLSGNKVLTNLLLAINTTLVEKYRRYIEKQSSEQLKRERKFLYRRKLELAIATGKLPPITMICAEYAPDVPNYEFGVFKEIIVELIYNKRNIVVDDENNYLRRDNRIEHINAIIGRNVKYGN